MQQIRWYRTEHPVRAAPLATPVAPENGYVTVPGPNLGIEVNRDALERFRAVSDAGGAVR